MDSLKGLDLFLMGDDIKTGTIAVTQYSNMPNKTITSKDGVAINYTVYGAGEKVIVFVHCWMGDQTYWREQVDYFKDEFRVVTIDLAGHGKSGTNRTSWTINSYAEDVIAMMNELEFSKAYLVGHSMGGMVALDAASKTTRFQKLFLVDIISEKYWPMSENDARNSIEMLEGNFRVNTYHWVRDKMLLPSTDASLAEWIASDMADGNPEVGKASFFDMLTRNYDQSLQKVKEQQIPIYLMNSDRWKTDKKGLEKLGFRIEIIDGTGHFIMLEKPDAFNEILRELIHKLSLK